MGAYGSPELWPKQNNTQPKERIGFKRYKWNDEIPMTYFYIYIFVKFPINALRTAVLSYFTWVSSGTLLLSAVQVAIEAIACMGLYARKKWGYTLNRIYIIITGILTMFMLIALLFYQYQSISTAVIAITMYSFSVALHIFSFIYFEKRQVIFNK